MAVPNGVAMSRVSSPSCRLFVSASRSDGSCATDEKGSPQYHRKDAPCQLVRERPSLKENCTAIRTGTSDQAT